MREKRNTKEMKSTKKTIENFGKGYVKTKSEKLGQKKGSGVTEIGVLENAEHSNPIKEVLGILKNSGKMEIRQAYDEFKRCWLSQFFKNMKHKCWKV